jgi:N-methylhydantoinase A
MSLRLGIDTGGTFTDVIIVDEDDGSVVTTKTPSTPPDFQNGVLNGIDKIVDMTGKSPEDVTFISHGTTVGTNAILEEDFPKVGLITNEGLRDVIEIGDQTRPELFNFQTDKPPALVPRDLRKEVSGRVNSAGDIVEPIDTEQAKDVIDELGESDVDNVIISFLHSFMNNKHESIVGQLIEESEYSIDYSLTSNIHPEIREYPRTITTVLNELIKSHVDEYVTLLSNGINDRGITPPLNIMHSGGGIFSAEQAADYSIRTVLSGPAAGAVSTKEVSNQEGSVHAIGMDMGGTSTDVSVIRNNEIVRTTEGKIRELPIHIPMIDINTVGAGGGSITWIDDGGALRVGPESAGADPGPICYGSGGEEPTLTDANLLLRRLNPDYFLDGDMDLSVKKTKNIFESKIADPLGKSIEEAAISVLNVATASLSREIRQRTVERGSDPQEFTLVGFGGAGPLFASLVANQMNMNKVIIPNNPGVFSARGLLTADIRLDEAISYPDEDINISTMNNLFDELTEKLLSRYEEMGLEKELSTQKFADLRYSGQAYELTIPITNGIESSSDIESLFESFHNEHSRLYGHSMPEEDISIITLRQSGTVSTSSLEGSTTGSSNVDSRENREVYFEETGFTPTTVINRESITPDRKISGPAILEDRGSTTVITPGSTARVSEYGNVIIEREG